MPHQPRRPDEEETEQQMMSAEQKEARDHKTVRGEDLREQMIKSQEEGEDFRATNFGSDVRKPDIDHEESHGRRNDKEEPSKTSMSEKRLH